MTRIRTIDHDEIRAWIEEHGGTPAIIRNTTRGESEGVLTINFNGKNPDLQHVSWREFFEMFDERKLRFRCLRPVTRARAAWVYSFESAETAHDSGEYEGMPENLEYMAENIYSGEPIINEWAEGRQIV